MNVFKILTILFIFTNCKVATIEQDVGIENKHLATIIYDVSNRNKKFYKSDIFRITKVKLYDEERYIVTNKYSENGVNVVPDSVESYLNSFLEYQDRLFLFNSARSKRSNSEIYRKAKKFGLVLDSCVYKYKYLEQDGAKLLECGLQSKSYIQIHPETVIYIFDKKDSLKFKKKENFH